MRLTQRQGDEESKLDQPDQSSAPSGLGVLGQSLAL